MARVFLSYRREDSAGYTGRIFDHLRARFGANRVFMDVEDIDAGENFVKVIEASIASCDTVVAVIGKQWAKASEASGARRMDDPADYVRRELAITLRLGVDLVPVLVGVAEFPSKQDLPEELADMTFHNALQIDDKAFLPGVDRLIAVLERSTALAAERRRLAAPAQKKDERRGPSSWNLGRLLLLYEPTHRATWILHILFYLAFFFAIFTPLIIVSDRDTRSYPDDFPLAAAMFAGFFGVLALLRAIVTVVEPDESSSRIRRWWLLYKPLDAGTAGLHALFVLMLAVASISVIMLFVGHTAGVVRFVLMWVILTLLVREVAAARDPLRRKGAEPSWFSRLLYLWRPFRNSKLVPRILFYWSGLMFLIVLPTVFAADDGGLSWPSTAFNRGALTKAALYLALAVCARGWVRSSEVLRDQIQPERAHHGVWRMLMLYIPSRKAECVPQVLFWFAMLLLVGLLARRDATLSLLGLEVGANWVYLSVLLVLLALSAHRWAQFYEWRADTLPLRTTTNRS